MSAFALLALASAAVYGAADFIGGFASRRASTLAIVVVSQAAGLVIVGALLAVVPGVASSRDWVWSGVAGLAGGLGVSLLYRALAIGTMAVVAPVTAVLAVAVPVLVGLVLGERPTTQALSGIGLALVAIVLVSQQTGASAAPMAQRAALGLALLSGVAVGLFFLALARASRDAGLWPLFVARLASVSLFVSGAAVVRQSLRLDRGPLVMAIGGGALDMLANILYLLATRQGPLTLAVTLASLYPASTVLLARMVLGERLALLQWLGVLCALAAIVVIVTG